MNNPAPSDYAFGENDTPLSAGADGNMQPPSPVLASPPLTPAPSAPAPGESGTGPADLEQSARDLFMAQLQLGTQELPRRQPFRQATMLVAAATTIGYLVFRAWFTLNLAGPFSAVFSLSLLLAESYAAFVLFLYFFQTWRLVEPEIKPPLPGRSVDVLVPTYNEEVTLLRGTLTACVEMEYPHTTYVLDDGNRPEVRELAESLGVQYIARQENGHAKAGNLNHALKVTNGEFLVILDADHVPLRHFLARLIGYFEDPKLGFVQAPHTTYNFDNFLGRWKARLRVYWEDVLIFFKAVQLGKNTWNSACFCGSAAMFRRAALEEVGGLATETITEDLHTGMRLHAAGWNSLAVSEQLVAGLAPEDSVTFNQQRLRWGEGNLSVLAYDNPLTMKGLSLAQRINYLASILNWSFGPARLVMYLTPLVMLFTGITPVKDVGAIYFAVVAVYLIAVWTAVKVVSNGCGHIFWIEHAMMGAFFVQVRALFRAVFLRRWQRFVVTSKRSSRRTSQMLAVLPQTLILAFGLAAVLWATLKVGLGLSADYLGLAIGGGLAFYHGGLAALIVLKGIRVKGDRVAWRHPAKLLAEYSTSGFSNCNTIKKAVVLDFNEFGCRILTNHPIKHPCDLEVRIHSPLQSITCSGSVIGSIEARKNRRAEAVGWVHRVAFDSPTPEQAKAIWTIAIQYLVPKLTARYRLRYSWRQSFIGRTLGFFRMLRTAPRVGLPLPVGVESPIPCDPVEQSVTDVISERAVWVTLNHALLRGANARLTIQLPGGREFVTDATVGTIRASRIGSAVVQRHQFRVSEEDPEAAKALGGLVRKARTHSWDRVVSRWEPHATQRLRIDKAAVLLVGMAGILAATLLAFHVVYRDDMLLLSAGSGDLLGREQVEEVSEIVHANATSRFASTERLLRSYEASVALGQDAGAALIAARMAEDSQTDAHIWSLTEARHLVENQENEKAAAVFDRLLSPEHRMAFPPSERVRLYVEAARNAVAVEDVDQAARLFEQAMNLESRNSVLLREFVGILASSGRLDMALQLLEQFEPTDEVLQLRSGLFEMGGNEEQAVPVMEELLRRHPEDRTTLTRLAEIAVVARDFAKAAAHYETLIEKQPDDGKARAGLGNMFTAMAREAVSDRDFDRAVPEFERALSIAPSQPLRAEFAGVLVTAKRIPEAIDQLRSCDTPEAKLQLASLFEMEGRHDDAGEIYESLRVTQGDAPVMMRKMAASLEASGRLESAVGLLRELHTRGLATSDDNARLARVLVSLGYHDDALPHFRQLSKRFSEDQRHWSGYVAAVAAAENLDDADRQNVKKVFEAYARADFRKVVRSDIEHLADALRKLDELEQAVQTLRAGVREFPDARYLRLRLADTLQRLGQFNEAEKHYQRLLDDRAPSDRG